MSSEQAGKQEWGETGAPSFFGGPTLQNKLPIAETQVLGHPKFFRAGLYLLAHQIAAVCSPNCLNSFCKTKPPLSVELDVAAHSPQVGMLLSGLAACFLSPRIYTKSWMSRSFPFLL